MEPLDVSELKATKANPWLVRPRRSGAGAGVAPRMQLYCFPYAGGGSSVYRTWPEGLPAEVEVVAVELPGRDTRFKERPYDRLAPMVEAIVDGIGGEIGARPFALYGHSMGALIGFAVARELRRRGLGEARQLLVSGRRAPRGSCELELFEGGHFFHQQQRGLFLETLGRKLAAIVAAL
jgi:surfactin synthase thioesterase subunit